MSAEQTAYRLFLSEQEWNALSDKLRDPYFKTIAATNLEAVRHFEEEHSETLLHPPGTLAGSGPPRRPNWRILKNRLLRATVAWYLTREQRHLDHALATIDHFIANGGGKSHGAVRARKADLKTGEDMYVASFALDVLEPFLGDGRIEALRAAVEHMLRSYLEGIEAKEWWRHSDFNWNTAVHGNAGLAALAIRPCIPDLAARVLDEARSGLRYVVAAFLPGGGWTEGPMYLATTLGHLTDFIAALDRIDGDDLGLPANRNLHDVFTSRLYMLGGDGRSINFSDCGEESAEWMLPHAYWWARKCSRPDWTSFEDMHVKPWRESGGLFHDVEAFWYRPVFPETQEPAPVRGLHMQGLDWYVWRGGRAWLGFRGGFNGGNHNHRDLGSFIFGAGPDRFLIDPGYGASDVAKHNAVSLWNKDQTECARAPIFRLHEHPGGFYLACDLSDAYPLRASYYYRHLLLIDETHLLVLDDIMGRAGMRNGASFHLQTCLPHELTDGGVCLRGAHAALNIRILEPPDQITVHEWTWRNAQITTLSWYEEWDHVHSVHPMLLSLADEPFSYEWGRDTATLRIRGAAYEIDLAECVMRRRDA
ncbi:hypothetical protein GX586_05965 [bacterium]|nr:hypothetical protein [bacterium]